jgi:hypothetical protein
MRTMHVNRGLLFWGLALVTAGAIALASSQGWIESGLLVGLWRLWPVVLIAIGLSIVLSRTPLAIIGTLIAALVVGVAGGALLAAGPGTVACGDGPSTTETSGGEFTVPEATVDLDLNCGDLRVALTDGAGWQAVTGVNDDDPPQLNAMEGSLDIRSNGGSVPFRRERQDWGITLGRDVAYEISASLNAADATFDLGGGSFGRIGLDPNAGSVDLDLTGAEVADLRVSLNAGSLSVTADTETDIGGVINVNAGSVNLCVPDGTALRIGVDSSVAFAHDLDESGLVQTDDTYTSDGFESADNRIELRLEGNAASFDLNPEDGCE